MSEETGNAGDQPRKPIAGEAHVTPGEGSAELSDGQLESVSGGVLPHGTIPSQITLTPAPPSPLPIPYPVISKL
jgi:hypothetical protein